MSRKLVVAAALLLVASLALSFRPWLLLVVVLVNLLIALLYAWHHRRPLRQLDRLFWAVTLRPLVGLPPSERRRRIEELARTSLDHPVQGKVCLPAALLERKLARMAALPLGRIIDGDLLAQREAQERFGAR